MSTSDMPYSRSTKPAGPRRCNYEDGWTGRYLGACLLPLRRRLPKNLFAPSARTLPGGPGDEHRCVGTLGMEREKPGEGESMLAPT